MWSICGFAVLAWFVFSVPCCLVLGRMMSAAETRSVVRASYRKPRHTAQARGDAAVSRARMALPSPS